MVDGKYFSFFSKKKTCYFCTREFENRTNNAFATDQILEQGKKPKISLSNNFCQLKIVYSNFDGRNLVNYYEKNDFACREEFVHNAFFSSMHQNLDAKNEVGNFCRKNFATNEKLWKKTQLEIIQPIV